MCQLFEGATERVQNGYFKEPEGRGVFLQLFIIGLPEHCFFKMVFISENVKDVLEMLTSYLTVIQKSKTRK